ncbi:HET-domain-containing protein [Podospora conica]|nr:HET-domain-containing protein [Schizothecium conicum]
MSEFSYTSQRSQSMATAILGSLGEIQARRCPFCALIAHAVFEIQLQVTGTFILEPSDQIGVWWGENTGLFGFNILFKGRGSSGGTIISALGANPATSPQPDFSLRPPPSCLREVHKSEINIDRALRWVQLCRDNHNECRSKTVKGAPIPSVFPGLKVMRLIDVKNRCLIETRRFLRYTTLSYVWGNTSSLRLTRANMPGLSEPGGISRRWTLVARTIRDAIDLVEKMGERFLWVDSLCLVQNDAADLKLGTTVMDLVYAESTLTVIAASGHDANAGLPGVHHGTRRPSQQLRVIGGGLTMGVHTTLTDLVKRTVYNTRAWTYQEQHLSRRSLFFVDNKIFFRCAEANFCEDTLDSASSKTKPHENENMRPGQDRSAQGFHRTVSEYSTKTLTYQGDVLKAMSGIIRRLSSLMKCDWFCGAPTAFFDLTLLFTSPDLLRRRNNFPSYSWTGWIGCIQFAECSFHGVNQWLEQNTWIIWYQQDSPDQPPRLVWDPEANQNFPTHDLNFQGYRQRSSFEAILSVNIGFSCRTTSPTRGWQPTRAFPEYPILRFWTISALFKVRISDPVRGVGKIVNRFGEVCGTLRIDGFEETVAFENVGPFSFVLLSVSTGAADMRNLITFGPLVKSFRWMFYVLCVEWEGGIAERRGLGIIDMASLGESFSPGPVWQEVFLA